MDFQEKRKLRAVIVALALLMSATSLTPSLAQGQSGPFKIRDLSEGKFNAVFSSGSALSPAATDTGEGLLDETAGELAVGGKATGEQTLAQYDFVSPGSPLAREIQSSDKVAQLQVVPTPPNLRRNQNRDRNDYEHTVLLRADNSTQFAAFKTVAGTLFCKSGAMVWLSTSRSVVRILNITGVGDQVLFKLPQQQIVALGRGVELIVAPKISTAMRNPADGIARRGFSDVQMMTNFQMAFAQFSHQSLLDLPEFKYFRTANKPENEQRVLETAKAVAIERGDAGFKKTIALSECNRKPQQTTIDPAKPIASANPINIESKPKETSVAEVQTVKKASPVLAVKESIKKAAQARGTAPGVGATASFAKPKPKATQIAALPATVHASQPHQASPAPSAQAPSISKTPSEPPKTKRAPATRRTVKDLAGALIAHNDESKPRAPKKAKAVVAQMSEPAESALETNVEGLPADAKSLLLAAEQEDKNCAKFTKQADKKREFLAGGLLNEEQRHKMQTEVNLLMVHAEAAKQKASKLKAQAVQIAATSKPSM